MIIILNDNEMSISKPIGAISKCLSSTTATKFYQEIKGNLYCGVAIYDEKKSQWTWKYDCGTESNTEKEKGEASDNFKRACVNWGIGRELYTSPNIRIFCEIVNKQLPQEEKNRRFKVQEIGYNDKGEINKLVIIDNKGVQVYPKTTTTQQVEEKKESQHSGLKCEMCNKEITDKVANYSKQNYKKVLCMDCQKKQPIEEREI